MRILGVSPYLPPEGGGLERYAFEILRRLAAAGHEVHAIAFTRDEPGKQVREGLAIERVRASFRLGNAPVAPSFGRQVDQVIRDFRPDVVLAHTPVPFPAEMAFRAARRNRVPFVTTYHAGRLRASRRILAPLALLDRLTFERAMLRGSDRLIAVSPYVRDTALAAQTRKVHIIPPGVDAERFRFAPPRATRTILFVGPLDDAYRWKGIDVLWRAFGALHAADPATRLLFVGDGDRAAEFRHKAQPFQGAVQLLGRLSDAELPAAYQAADVVVLPSVTDAESFGMVLAEANACGRPVVGSAIGGIPSFVRHGVNGLLAAPGDASDLAHQIAHLLDHPEEAARMGAEGHAHVVRAHDWDVLARETESVLQAAVDGTRRPASALHPMQAAAL